VTVVSAAARRRWLVVGTAAIVLAGLPVAVGALPVRVPVGDVGLLAARIRTSAGQPYQGYAVSTVTAGLPALPQLNDVTDLLDGDTRLRVWYASAQRWRADVLDVAAERDTYQLPGRQVTWDYSRAQLTEIDGVSPVRLPQGADLVPPELARRLIAAGDPVSGLAPKRVAGIDATGLRITPASPDTTVGHVDVWADPGTGLPLEVTVTARGGGPAILVSRFLDVDLRAPAGQVLTPPPAGPGIGYTVTSATDLLRTLVGRGLGALPERLAGQDRVATSPTGLTAAAAYGSGLAQFLVLSVPRQVGFDAMDRASRGGAIRIPFPDGEGELIATPLLSVLAMDADPARRTYLLAGLVAPAVLRQAGAQLSSFVVSQ
jgi:hypothetical protein